jgi:uncharacterized metal-binding protein YceD (DUF177 family)
MNEFTRPMTPAEAKRQSEPLHLVADEAERAAIAKRFGLLSVDRLEATLAIMAEGDSVKAEGTLGAALVQACIASGEPVPAALATPIAVRFVPNAALEVAQEDAQIELASDDLDVIGFVGGRFDLGEMVAESLALELDPYPRSPDAERFLKERGVKGESEVGSFGALAALRDRLVRATDDPAAED